MNLDKNITDDKEKSKININHKRKISSVVKEENTIVSSKTSSNSNLNIIPSTIFPKNMNAPLPKKSMNLYNTSNKNGK